MSPSRQEVVKKQGEAPRQTVAAGTATEMQVLLGAADGAPNFAMRRFIMGAGGGMPRHTNTVEHQQYVLQGRARVTIGDQADIPEHQRDNKVGTDGEHVPQERTAPVRPHRHQLPQADEWAGPIFQFHA